MTIRRMWWCLLWIWVFSAAVAQAQDTASLNGSVRDSSGAVVANAQVEVSSAERGVSRKTTTNSDGEYAVPALAAPASYNVTITAQGFKRYEARGVILRVAQKARIDTTLQVGASSTLITVEGTSVAQVETQSSDLSGTVTGTQISQLQLNGRNFAQLVTLVPGVVSRTGQDEGQVGVNGSVSYSMNGGRTEYNNWEIDGGDNMDNGSNASLNVYPSLDAIAEFKVLTSNYGAQYGRNASGTVEVETKSGTNAFHGDVYYFGRNDAFNARNYFDPAGEKTPTFKKHEFGYTIGGPVSFLGYNKGKDKTFFFFSEGWRRDLVPGTVFHVPVPSDAERGVTTPGFGDFSDVCPGADCPNVADPTAIPIDVNAQAILAMIPQSNADPTVCGSASYVGCYNASPANKTTWREELVRVDHNFNSKWRGTFRYIHDSWQTVTPSTLWSCGDADNGCSFPTIQTNFVGPGLSAVARLATTASPTLLNEFVASYTTDHITLSNIGPGAVARPSSMTMTGIFPDFGNKLPGIYVTGNADVYSFEEDNAYIPWKNSNPTYTLRDNVTKITGKHNLQFGAYAVIAQKNEQSSFGAQQGLLTFDASNSNVSTGNSFADLLLGNISTFQQVNSEPKYYFRYKILEPYFQDDWHITPHLTLNLGVRLSLFQTYREKLNQTYNFQQSAWDMNNAPAIGSDGELVDPVSGLPLTIDDPRDYNGMVHCGGPGQRPGCVEGHLFNPAPRLGFAWDPKGDGKWAVRGGYGIFYEHGNGNEQNVEALEATPPFVLNPTQPNIIGYTNIGSGGGTIEAFPLGFNAIATKGRWPYVQQFNLNVQHELPHHVVATAAYVGSKGTHLGRRLDLNQVHDLTDPNPYQPGEAWTQNDCTSLATPSGTPITGDALLHLNIVCGGDPSPYRPFVGFSNINWMQFAASSTYNALQFSARRSISPLTLSVSYTYSHSIDDSSTGGAFNAGSIIDSYNLKSGRSSSDYDVRHNFSLSWVYDLPFFRGAGLTNTLLGGWEYSGIITTQTGVPFSVLYSGVSDNAGVSNGSGPGTSFADIVGNPKSNIPASEPNTPPFLYNPAAFAAPQGLTFGNSGRNSLRNPRTTNVDMAIFKHFKLSERTSFEFRVESFNILNHTQWDGVDNDQASSSFLQPGGAHRARTMQFGAKFIF